MAPKRIQLATPLIMIYPCGCHREKASSILFYYGISSIRLFPSLTLYSYLIEFRARRFEKSPPFFAIEKLVCFSVSSSHLLGVSFIYIDIDRTCRTTIKYALKPPRKERESGSWVRASRYIDEPYVRLFVCFTSVTAGRGCTQMPPVSSVRFIVQSQREMPLGRLTKEKSRKMPCHSFIMLEITGTLFTCRFGIRR